MKDIWSNNNGKKMSSRKLRWGKCLFLALMCMVSAERASAVEVGGSDRKDRFKTVTHTDKSTCFNNIGATTAGSWKFVTKQGVTSVSSGWSVDSVTETSASASRSQPITEPEAFSVSLSGEMYIPGGQGGSPLPWRVQEQNCWYLIKESSSGGRKDEVIMIYKGNVTLEACRNLAGSSTTRKSKWKITPPSGGTTITVNDVASIKIGPDSENQELKELAPGIYTINAEDVDPTYQNPDSGEKENLGDQNDNVTLKIIAPDTLSGKVDGDIYFQAITSKFGIDNAENLYCGNKPKTSYLATVIPTIPHDGLPNNWIMDDIDLPKYVPDAEQPKLKGGMTLAEGETANGYVGVGCLAQKKWIKVIRFKLDLKMVDGYQNIWVFKDKSRTEYCDLFAQVDPASLETNKDFENVKYEWEVIDGKDKVKLDFAPFSDNEKHNYCRVSPAGVDKVSTQDKDITIRVSWKYNDDTKDSKDYLLTVKTVTRLVQTNQTHPGVREWYVYFKYKDNFGDDVPHHIIAGFYVDESWSTQMWPGWEFAGGVTLENNSFPDHLVMPGILDVNTPGNGHQTIIIDHYSRSHDAIREAASPTISYKPPCE